jgi:hypothetical protein
MNFKGRTPPAALSQRNRTGTPLPPQPPKKDFPHRWSSLCPQPTPAPPRHHSRSGVACTVASKQEQQTQTNLGSDEETNLRDSTSAGLEGAGNPQSLCLSLQGCFGFCRGRPQDSLVCVRSGLRKACSFLEQSTQNGELNLSASDSRALRQVHDRVHTLLEWAFQANCSASEVGLQTGAALPT